MGEELEEGLQGGGGGGGGGLLLDIDSSFTSTTSSATFTSSTSSCSCSSARTSLSFERAASVDPRLSSSAGLLKPHPHHAAHPHWSAIRAAAALSPDGSIHLRHLKLLRQLGSGNLACVYHCRLLDSSSPDFALKVVDTEALASANDTDKLSHVKIEGEVLSTLDHPFLPTLYARIESSRHTCFLIDYCHGGDLHTLLRRQPAGRFPLQVARFYAAEVLLALEYLHACGFVYRDLKPENVLLRGDGHIMLSDFDLCLKADVSPAVQDIKVAVLAAAAATPAPLVVAADSSFFSFAAKKKKKIKSRMKGTGAAPADHAAAGSNKNKFLRCCFIGGGGRHRTGRATTDDEEGPEAVVHVIRREIVAEPRGAKSTECVGTHEYLAPEVLTREGHGNGVDWWAFGVFLYEMLHGRTPFKGGNKESTLKNIRSKPLRLPESARPDPEMAAARDLIERLLVKDPRRRLGSARGAADIKRHPFFDGIKWPLIRNCPAPAVGRGVGGGGRRNSLKKKVSVLP